MCVPKNKIELKPVRYQKMFSLKTLKQQPGKKHVLGFQCYFETKFCLLLNSGILCHCIEIGIYFCTVQKQHTHNETCKQRSLVFHVWDIFLLFWKIYTLLLLLLYPVTWKKYNIFEGLKFKTNDKQKKNIVFHRANCIY